MTVTAPHLTLVGPAHAQAVLMDPQDRRGAVDATGYPAPTTNAHVRAWVRGRVRRGGRSLAGVRLPHSDLSGMEIPGADFPSADLFGASFKGAELTAANFADADLRNADFRGADLTAANFRGADLLGAIFDDETRTTGIDWDSATRWPTSFRPPAPLFGPSGR